MGDGMGEDRPLWWFDLVQVFFLIVQSGSKVVVVLSWWSQSRESALVWLEQSFSCPRHAIDHRSLTCLGLRFRRESCIEPSLEASWSLCLRTPLNTETSNATSRIRKLDWNNTFALSHLRHHLHHIITQKANHASQKGLHHSVPLRHPSQLDKSNNRRPLLRRPTHSFSQ